MRVANFLTYAICSLVFLASYTLNAHIDPLSKITVTSKRATCRKDTAGAKNIVLNYLDDVRVTFADNSTITADSVEIMANGKSQEKKQSQAALDQKKAHSDFKKITFKKNVHLTLHSPKGNRRARADRAELCLPQSLCTLEGNVKIWQPKNSPKEVPVTIESSRALLNLKTEEVTLLGESEKPVSTVIEFNSYPKPAPAKQAQKAQSKVPDKKNSPAQAFQSQTQYVQSVRAQALRAKNAPKRNLPAQNHYHKPKRA